MMRNGCVMLGALLVGLSAGCAAESKSIQEEALGASSEVKEWHVLKLGLAWRKPIRDPYKWALMQFADGPIEGPGISEYARMMMKAGLDEARSDIDGDGKPELFLRSDVGARVHTYLVFTPLARSGYGYLGSVPATIIAAGKRRMGDPPTVIAYERTGRNDGWHRVFVHRDGKLVVVSEELVKLRNRADEYEEDWLRYLEPIDERILDFKHVQDPFGRGD